MNRDETMKILGMIRAAYPAFHAHSGEKDIATAVDVWQMMLSDVPFQAMQMALKAFIAKDVKGFPPGIGALKEELVKLQEGGEGEMSEQEAWTLVSRALRNGIYGYHKEFAELPETIRRCIGSPMMLHEWAMMDIGEVNTVVSSNFMRSYRARAAHAREMSKLPPDVKALFGAVAEAMRLGGGRERNGDGGEALDRGGRERGEMERDEMERDEVPKLRRDGMESGEVPKLRRDGMERGEAPEELRRDEMESGEVPKLRRDGMERGEVPKLRRDEMKRGEASEASEVPEASGAAPPPEWWAEARRRFEEAALRTQTQAARKAREKFGTPEI